MVPQGIPPSSIILVYPMPCIGCSCSPKHHSVIATCNVHNTQNIMLQFLGGGLKREEREQLPESRKENW